ncbi:MAG: ribose 5-phosphate isomerase B [Nitrospirae bacterium]|nr:MAG: ribose 5-phosphate isomerase B [Nitrospirota bacterium]
MSDNKIAIGCDHAGLELKEQLKSLLTSLGFEPVDYGTKDDCSVDYPDYGEKVSLAVSRGEFQRGILICGTGLGMSIVANKFPGVRATLCHDEYTARMSREHNNSNILVLGGRVLEKQTALNIVKVWLETPFEGGRHERRLEKISSIEQRIINGL